MTLPHFCFRNFIRYWKREPEVVICWKHSEIIIIRLYKQLTVVEFLMSMANGKIMVTYIHYLAVMISSSPHLSGLEK